MKPLLRKVKLASSVVSPYKINGYFHEWGNIVDFNEELGCFPKKVAIVELEDGTVKVFDPFLVKFVDAF